MAQPKAIIGSTLPASQPASQPGPRAAKRRASQPLDLRFRPLQPIAKLRHLALEDDLVDGRDRRLLPPPGAVRRRLDRPRLGLPGRDLRGFRRAFAPPADAGPVDLLERL